MPERTLISQNQIGGQSNIQSSQIISQMSILVSQYDLLKDRIRLGSMAVEREQYPFVSFLIGYFVGKVNADIDLIFELVEMIHLLVKQQLISPFLTFQIFKVTEDFPKDIRRMVRVLEDLKSGKQINLIKVVESYYGDIDSNAWQVPALLQNQPKPQTKLNHKQELANDGTLQLDSPSQIYLSQNYKQQQLDLQKRRQMEQADIQMAKRMQEQFNQQKDGNNQDNDVPCEICQSGLYDDEFVPLERCSHLFHKNCLVETFKTNISTNNFPIRCPKDECKQQINQMDIKAILSPDLYQKYSEHTLKAYAEMHGDSISWCPTASCGYMFFFQKKDNERFQCAECKKEYCLNCRVQWHKDMTCKEYKISSTMSEDDEKFMTFVKGKKFKQCPKCKFWVQKNLGCDHMTCKCKFEFCYKCGGVYMKCECAEKAREELQARRKRAEEKQRKKQERQQRLKRQQEQKSSRETRPKRKK